MAEFTERDQLDANQAYSQMLKDPARRSIPCIVCGGPPDFIGIYCPSEKIARRIGQPKGKRRFVGYTICAACVHEPGNADRVENLIIRDMGAH